MDELDHVLAVVTGQKTRLDGLKALIVGLRQQLTDAVNHPAVPAEVQAKVTAILAAAEDNTHAIDAAIDAGTLKTPGAKVVLPPLEPIGGTNWNPLPPNAPMGTFVDASESEPATANPLPPRV